MEAFTGSPDTVTDLRLTSADHYFWNVPRRIRLVGLLPGPEPDSEYGRALVAGDQTDGPMELALRRRDGGSLVGPLPEQGWDVMLWRLDDSNDAWLGDQFHPPRPRPDAWATLAPNAGAAHPLTGRPGW